MEPLKEFFEAFEGKAVIASCLLLIFSITAFVGSESQPQNYHYALLTLMPIQKNKVRADVDYGNGAETITENGEMKRFVSSMDALNYLAQEGWEVVHFYTIPMAGNLEAHRYLLKREI